MDYRNVSRRGFLGLFGAAAATTAGLSLAGCDDKETSSGGGDSSKKTKKVAMFLDGPVNDGGWGASCYGAMVDSAKQHGWETAYSESVAQADWVSTMQNYVDQGYDLIVAPGNQYTADVKQVAKDNPDAKFCIFNDEVSDVANIECTIPNTIQIGQLAGALAGLMTKTKSIGFIGGVELDTTKNKIKGYTEAAKKVDSSIQVTTAYAGSFSDAAKGKELASGMISTQNIDVMFGDASIVDTGAREALVAAGSDRYDIGQPGDITKDSPCIICSVVIDNVKMTNEVLDDVEAGKFGKKTVYGDLSNGGVAVGTYSDAVSADVKSQYEEIVKKISDGSFV